MNTVVDRVVQYPHRYQLKNVNTGEVLGTFDLEPITGTISVVGTKIDKALFDSIATDIGARLVSNGGDAKDNIITYTMASDRNNIVSGEKLSVSFGKIARYINDLKAIAFSGNKADIGLGNVDNTSDLNKPISTAQQNAINKPLYNLGAFDTISGNVITRQTQYLTLNGSENWIYQSNYPRFYIEFTTEMPSAIKDDDSINIVSNILDCVSVNTTLISGNNEIAVGYRNLFIRKTDITSVDDLKNWLSQNPITIQYKLATSYTEEIIEGQPLITLDSQGSQWLRSEWEKGLNLFDFTTANPNYYKTGLINGDANVNNNGTMIVGVDASTDYGRGFKIQVKANTTYTFSFTKNIADILFVEAFQNNTSIKLNSFTTSSRLSLTFTTNDSSDFVVLGFSTTVSAIGNLTISDLMLNEGDHAYPYQPYNSKAHITNYEADFLKEESLKSANLFDKTKATNGKALGEWTLFDSENMSASDIIYVKPNTTYTFNYVRVLCFGDINGNYISGSRKFLDSTNFTFTTPSNCYCIKFDTTIERLDTIMLNEGTEPLPYQEYNGSIVREKQLKELDNKKANKSETYTKEETDSALASAKSYTDTKIANLVGTAPETMDTLEEVANAIKEHKDVADALNAAIGNKANSSDLNAHTGNTNNPHNVTKTQLGLENVDNTKDSDKNVASAKILKNNDVSSFTLSNGFTSEINFNSNSVYLIYNNIWNFIIRTSGLKSQSTVCYNESDLKPLWFKFDNTAIIQRLHLKTLSSNSATTYSYNGTFNYKLLSTD